MAALSPLVRQRFFDANGKPLIGGKLFTYQAGTTTPKTTYLDKDNTPNTNPIILDSQGYCDLWLGSGFYKYVLTDSNDVEQWTIDKISANSPTGGTITADSITTYELYLGTINMLKTVNEIFGSQVEPIAINSVDGINPTLTERQQSIIFITGDGAPISIVADPQIVPGQLIGQRLTVIGCSDGNTVTIESGHGIDSGGAKIVFVAGSMATFIWSGLNWILESTNGV